MQFYEELLSRIAARAIQFSLSSEWRDKLYLLFCQPRAYAVALATEAKEKIADPQLRMLMWTLSMSRLY